MVKFRKNALNAGSGNQHNMTIIGVFGETIITIL